MKDGVFALLISLVMVKADVSVLGGDTAVLECKHKTLTEDALIMITWKASWLHNSHCIYSFWKEKNLEFNNCSSRMGINSTSFRIYNAKVTDEGTYACELITIYGTFINHIILQVFVQPSVTLRLNTDRVPECRAHGGNPAANISWIPAAAHSITTDTTMQSDWTWTVTSKYCATNLSRVELTCVVSHPTFLYPQNKSMNVATSGVHYICGLVMPVTVFIFVLGLLFWQI
ncbi:cell surface glycoprotein CD200 receptor 1-B-like [Xenopus laevis]|uniref:Cell surface glycoprotein CD200 receptor 1-B-like n=1 Tax=Xenopus laevis TaxID=8355 RepID=A0A8J1M5Y7_XENLA|nr:cell surface glycoprotein CD200 receptor 1-B-like [Xenopus laevis]